MTHFIHHDVQYAGFWRRLMAFSLDTMMVSIISAGIIITLFGYDNFLQLQHSSINTSFDWRIILVEQGLPAVWAIGFWQVWMATPGKLLMDCQIVDARTHQKARFSKLVIRYLSYILSALPLGLGFLWILFDKHKQGWHDKLANTVVIMQDESLNSLESYA